MNAQTYFRFHFCILICLPICINAVEDISDADLYNDMYTNQKMCGNKLADIMSSICRTLNGYRSKRSIGNECCKNACNYYYLMKYYCADPRVPIDSLPPYPSSTMSPTNSWPLRKILPSPESTQSSTERINQSTENNYSGQGKIPKSNHINKEKEQSESSEVNSRPPAKFGTMHSNQQAPIIYPHSNTIEKGHFNYQRTTN